jgi:DNA-binding response OmpR family regulator
VSARRILVVDDSATLRKLIELSFEQEPLQIEFAESGAVGQRKAHESPPDLILLDFILPDMRAPEFAAWCAKHPHLAYVPLLIMSAKRDNVRESFSCNPLVVGFIPKPFTSKQITGHVSNILDRRMRGEALGSLSGTHVRRVNAKQRELIAQAMYSCLRPQLTRLPELVQQLGDDEPAPFLGRKLLTPRVVDELLEVVGPLLSESRGAVSGANSELFGGQLGSLPLLTLLKMLSDQELSGILSLVDDAGQKLRVYMRWGAILSVTCHDPKAYVRAAGVELEPVPAAVWSHCEAEQRSSAKPIYVSLAEAGALAADRLPILLLRQGKRLLLEAVAVGNQRFVWNEAMPMPPYVIAYGQALFLGQMELELARRVPASPAAEQRLLTSESRFVRCAEFNRSVRHFDLDEAELRVLEMTDGQPGLIDLAQRARLDPREVARVMNRLSRVGLVQEVSSVE